MAARAVVIIPAHDEVALIGGTLRALLADLPAGRRDVVVVANGCADDTAAVARTFEGVRVIELPEASKALALTVGSRVLDGLPRVQLDADCAIAGRDVLLLVEALAEPGVLAAGPARRLDTAGASWWVRGYYRVWERLPGVREGLYGRGVIALSAEGQERVDALPRVQSDDLAISEVFGPGERRVVPQAVVTIRVPRNARDLVRRRVRVATGNHQADRLGIRRPTSRTSVPTLAALARSDPRLLPALGVFLTTTVLSRLLSRGAVRRGDYTTWLRDESSRLAG
jgi:glycosyltransferase involved in cell wall biosynthesis